MVFTYSLRKRNGRVLSKNWSIFYPSTTLHTVLCKLVSDLQQENSQVSKVQSFPDFHKANVTILSTLDLIHVKRTLKNKTKNKQSKQTSKMLRMGQSFNITTSSFNFNSANIVVVFPRLAWATF